MRTFVQTLLQQPEVRMILFDSEKNVAKTAQNVRKSCQVSGICSLVLQGNKYFVRFVHQHLISTLHFVAAFLPTSRSLEKNCVSAGISCYLSSSLKNVKQICRALE